MDEHPPPLNLVLILTDHWRGDCLGRLGHPVAETPHLDSLSRQGATFTRAYTPCPSCIAARRSLWSGMTPASQGVIGFQDGTPWDFQHTLAGELKQAGYQTICIGKTHFHPPRLHLGFEQLYLHEDYEQWLAERGGAFGPSHLHGVPRNSWIGRPHYLPEPLTKEVWCTSKALECIARRDPTRPYFLCLSFNGPHPPWCPPQVYYDMFINRPMPAPVVGQWAQRHGDEAQYPLDVNAWRGRLPEHVHQRARAAYFAYLAFLDAQIGRLMTHLKPALKDALVVMSSDHGEMLGDHHLWRKTYAYEPSARVPFILRPPDRWNVPANRTIDQVVGWEDLMPTFLEAAGLSIPRTVEGRSVIPLLHGRAEGWREYYHGEHAPCYHPDNANQYLTDHRWKYIWNPSTGQEQLFDLPSDPAECHDLAGVKQHAQTLEHWRQRLVEHLRNRTEGLSNGRRLIPQPVPAVRGGPAQIHLG
jgi:arylsulfatase